MSAAGVMTVATPRPDQPKNISVIYTWFEAVALTEIGPKTSV
jgi:hypothetical protein